MQQQVLGHARAVVPYAEFERKRHTRLAARERQTNARAKGGRKLDLALAGVLANRLGGILDQIEEDLDQLVAIGEHRGQGGIVVLDELDVPCKTRMGEPFYMIEHHVNVDWLALDRSLVGEDFHTINEFDDPVGFLADQSGKAAIVIADGLFQQLSRAAYAGKRIFDFVR